ncbi:MAG: DUF3137 domain-containing protein [Litorimonas sp.]
MPSKRTTHKRLEGDWPTEIFAAQTQAFQAQLGSKLETEITPLQTKIGAKKHPWNIIQTLVLIGGGCAAFGLYTVSQQTLFPALAASAIGFLAANSVARKKNKTLRAAKSELGDYMQKAIGLNIYDVSHTHAASLQSFRQAGLLGRYEDIHYLSGLGPVTNQTINLQSIGTRLTRTETETYTDNKGRTRTRTHTVQVFEGLMLEFDIENFDSDNRILITSRRTYRFSGPFERIKHGAPQKLEKIKTASLKFNKHFKVSTDDHTLAHLFLDPERVMRFNNLYADLQQALDTKRAAISFLITQGRVWVAVETHGLPKLGQFSNKSRTFNREVGAIIGQATLPHIIAQHLEWPNPMPYAWQDHDAGGSER